MMKITGLSHLFKWENLHNWWLIKYFFAPLYVKCVIGLECEVCVVACKQQTQYNCATESFLEAHLKYIC